MSGSRLFEKMARDPRHFQILILSSLIVLQSAGSDFGPEVPVILLSLGGCLFCQTLFSKIFRVRFDFRSPLISGMSLSILLKASSLWFFALGALIVVGSKFLIRFRGKHLFNPTNLAIVVLTLLFPSVVWISPGQWGQGVWLAFFLCCAALLVLYQIPRRDMGPMFFLMWMGALFGRALWLGDPLSIPLHQMQNGALLIFCFFMISDPKTIPNRFAGRVVFGLLVALIAYVIQFGFYRTDGLMIALAAGCLFTPLIDFLLPGTAYQWGDRIQKHNKHKEAKLCIHPTS